MILFNKAIILIVSLIFSHAAIAGQEPATEEIKTSTIRLDIEQASKVIKEIMSMKEFQTTQTITDWQLNFDLGEEEVEAEESNNLWGLLVLAVARAVEYALWLVPVILVYILIHYRRYWIAYLRHPAKDSQIFVPAAIAGLELDADSLPDNIVQSAKQLWYSHKERDALSLLFRASLIRLINDYKIHLSNGSTEYECINAVKQSVTHDLAFYFELIAKIWINMAYAHIKPDQIEFERICTSWDKLFEREVFR